MVVERCWVINVISSLRKSIDGTNEIFSWCRRMLKVVDVEIACWKRVRAICRCGPVSCLWMRTSRFEMRLWLKTSLAWRLWSVDWFLWLWFELRARAQESYEEGVEHRCVHL